MSRVFNAFQEEKLVEMLAALSSPEEIRSIFARLGWPIPTTKDLRFYRHENMLSIHEMRKIRALGAATRGLAVAEERIYTLELMAEGLAGVLWDKDASGRRPYLTELRAVLADIAAETGGRSSKLKLDAVVDQIKVVLDIDPDKV